MTDAEDTSEEEEASLDRLSQAFAEVMGRSAVTTSSTDTTPEREADTADLAEISETEPGNCPLTPKTILEAILFVGHPENEPLQSSSIAKLLRGVESDEVDELVAELNQDYASHELPLVVASVGAGYALQLTPEMASVRDRFYGRVRAARLSMQAVDALAVVAYNQPISRKEVDKVMGVPCGRVLSQLVRRDLLALSMTDEKPRQRLYVTTDRFLALFGISTLQDLPRSEEPQ